MYKSAVITGLGLDKEYKIELNQKIYPAIPFKRLKEEDMIFPKDAEKNFLKLKPITGGWKKAIARNRRELPYLGQS